MKIEIPTSYSIDYPEGNYKYYDDPINLEILKKTLLKASDEYCMYCGKKLVNQGEYDFNIEHSIEKSNGHKNSFLRNCKFNLSVVCSKCNQKFKSLMIEKIDINDFDYRDCIEKESCVYPCQELRKAYANYFLKNSIIIQPHGVVNEKDGNKLRIEYNIVEEIFRESSELNYNSRDTNFILEHISRFGLNKNRFNNYFVSISEEILDHISDDLEYDRIFSKIEREKRDNKVEILFIDFMKKKCRTIESLKLLSELIIILSYL